MLLALSVWGSCLSCYLVRNLLFVIYSTFGVGMKFEFLFKSFYLLFEEENAVRLTILPYGSDLYLTDSLFFLRNSTKFSLCLRWMKLVFLFPSSDSCFGGRRSVFLTFLDFLSRLIFLWILMSMIHAVITCLIYLIKFSISAFNFAISWSLDLYLFLLLTDVWKVISICSFWCVLC